VGPSGRVIGVDLSLPMLAAAQARARARGWTNVRLVQSEGSRLRLPPASLDAALSTYTLTTVPGWPAALASLAAALRPGGRIAILDDRLPPGWFVGPLFMLRALGRDGWQLQAAAIARSLAPACGEIETRAFHAGLIYLVTAAKRG
jgi:ubiquinone/menaquinone biosynthesis C-methylase UbiE